MKITMGYSPCPNDTFMFHDVAAGALVAAGYQVEVHLHDIETLNELALAGRYDLTKMSAAASLQVRPIYQCLNSGAALGFGCGPLVVARRTITRDGLAQGRVALPGAWTTAHLLFQLWAPPTVRKLFVPYDRIMDAVRSSEVDAGVLIHESRFVLAGEERKRGHSTFSPGNCWATDAEEEKVECPLFPVADLGQWWEAETGLPLPLGCMMARRTLGERVIAELDHLLKQGIEHSRAEPQGTFDYVRRHAVEMDDEVIRKHIALYVTDFSTDLGETGRKALAALEQRARAAGVMK